MASRPDSATSGGQDRENTKLNQIIQVSKMSRTSVENMRADCDIALSHKGCLDDLFSSSESAADTDEIWRDQTEQMGEF
jgi:hypothetical protein